MARQASGQDNIFNKPTKGHIRERCYGQIKVIASKVPSDTQDILMDMDLIEGLTEQIRETLKKEPVGNKK